MNLWFPGLPRQRLTRGTTSENAASDPKKHMNDESSNPVYQHSTNIVPTFTNIYQHLPTWCSCSWHFMANLAFSMGFSMVFTKIWSIQQAPPDMAGRRRSQQLSPRGAAEHDQRARRGLGTLRGVGEQVGDRDLRHGGFLYGIYIYGYGSIPINTIFRGMNIHLPAILMFTRGTRFWHTAIWDIYIWYTLWLWLTVRHGKIHPCY